MPGTAYIFNSLPILSVPSSVGAAPAEVDAILHYFTTNQHICSSATETAVRPGRVYSSSSAGLSTTSISNMSGENPGMALPEPLEPYPRTE